MVPTAVVAVVGAAIATPVVLVAVAAVAGLAPVAATVTTTAALLLAGIATAAASLGWLEVACHAACTRRCRGETGRGARLARVTAAKYAGTERGIRRG